MNQQFRKFHSLWPGQNDYLLYILYVIDSIIVCGWDRFGQDNANIYKESFELVCDDISIIDNSTIHIRFGDNYLYFLYIIITVVICHVFPGLTPLQIT